MKLLTLEDYQKAGETFWPKYWYVAKELGEDAKPEDILKVMEAVGNVALKQLHNTSVNNRVNRPHDYQGPLYAPHPDLKKDA